MTELIDDAAPEQAKRLFTRFYGDKETDGLEDLGDALAQRVAAEMAQNKRVSMAALQGHFILHGPEDAVRECGSLFVQR